MKQLKQITYLNETLLDEMPQLREQAAQFPRDARNQRRLLRCLMNVRHPMPLKKEYLQVQDELLSEELGEKGIIQVKGLPACASDQRLILWQGDITRLNADAIVNAANSQLLGCFCPCHGCIDNAIHSAAGLQLRDECNRIMETQGYEEPTGRAKLTSGYNLPAKYVLHTVGPIIYGELTRNDCESLASCYRSCLELADEKELKSVAFCCISTGEFHFPNREAAEIAVDTVKDFLDSHNTHIQKVIFNVFKDIDKEIYTELLR